MILEIKNTRRKRLGRGFSWAFLSLFYLSLVGCGGELSNGGIVDNGFKDDDEEETQNGSAQKDQWRGDIAPEGNKYLADVKILGERIQIQVQSYKLQNQNDDIDQTTLVDSEGTELQFVVVEQICAVPLARITENGFEVYQCDEGVMHFVAPNGLLFAMTHELSEAERDQLIDSMQVVE